MEEARKIPHDVKRVKRTSIYSPNIVAIANIPGLIVPTRLYFFDRDQTNLKEITQAFGSLEIAVHKCLERVSRIPANGTNFQVGFVFGDHPNQNGDYEKDIFLYPFEYSEDDIDQPRSSAYPLKNFMMISGRMRQKLDSFPVILDGEQMSMRTKGYFRHIAEFPEIARIEYLN